MSVRLSLSLDELEHYASILGTKVLHDVSDGSFIPHALMLEWCEQHEDTIVLQKGDILTSNPSGEEVYQCQQYMAMNDIQINDVYPTTDAIINFLRNKFIRSQDNATETITDSHLQLRALIYSAVKNGASDIHLIITPALEQTIVKLRINGYLRVYAKWTDKMGIKIHSVAYNHLSSNKQDAFSLMLPQDMSFTEHFDGLSVRIRSSNIGTKNNGCKIVYRLLSIGNEGAPALHSLGYLPWQIALLQEVRNLSNGLVLICGETGSGKTTTLASIMSGLDHSLSAYSIEDPVEKYIDNVDQCPVDTRSEKRNFAYYLRALLRADPDVIMVGEIRDHETAEVAVQGSLTGHLILSTIHTKRAVNAVMRLHHLGIAPNQLATPDLLRIIVAQRLYPILCENCARTLTKQEKARLQSRYSADQMRSLKTFEYDSSCRTCSGTGIQGRRVFAEIIKVDRKSREFIADMNIRGWEKYLLSKGFVPMDELIHRSILSGEIDVFSLRAAEPIENDEYSYDTQLEDQ